MSGNTVYAGGDFTSIGWDFRRYIAALDGTTGYATPWNPYATDRVSALVVSGGTVYAGGSFHRIDGQLRNGIAALDAATDAVIPWDPNTNGSVQTLAVTGGTVYAAGTGIGLGAGPSRAPGPRDAWPRLGSVS